MLGILSLGSFCYYKYVFQKDYPIYAEASCDPSIEICFVYNCDRETEECTGNPEEDTYYYKEVRRIASQFPDCDPNGEDCLIDHCGESEVGCSVSLCDPEDAELTCTLVEDFVSEEPLEESTGIEEIGVDEGTNGGEISE